jgi:hypothetical protein
MEDLSGNSRDLLASLLGQSNRRRSEHWVSGIFARPSAASRALAAAGSHDDRHTRASADSSS